MNGAPHLRVEALCVPGVSHGFFGRAGGVSTGIYASLNTGLGSKDAPQATAENRARCAEALGIEPERLLTLYQTHSPNVVVVTEPWSGQGPKADAMVTKEPGVALGVLAADCMPFLFADPEARVIAAAHAGWRGALDGVLEATIAAMKELGAKPERIRAGLGPCLRQPNFEVGLDLVEAFTSKYPAAERFFDPDVSAEKRQFNLAGFGCWRLCEAGVEALDDIEICTFAAADGYFSYRASRRAGDDDFGRNLSAIALAIE